MKREAEIIEIRPRHKYMDGIVERVAAEVVIARDEKGEVHAFITGSLNGVPGAKVGQKGVIEWVKTPSSTLWYWRGENRR